MKYKNACTLKEQKDWIASCISFKTASKIKEIHFTRNLHGNVTMILDEWDPTVEEDGTIRAFRTSDDQIFVIIGENTLYANEDSSYMFAELIQCELIDGLHLINTKNVSVFDYAFEYCGENANFFTINGLENWDVSNVQTAYGMFYATGLKATIWSIGNLSSWNTAKIQDMSYMFTYAGYNATTWNVDLSAWNVSNVKRHDNFKTQNKIIEPNWVS